MEGALAFTGFALLVGAVVGVSIWAKQRAWRKLIPKDWEQRLWDKIDREAK